jgi:3-oxoacyl-[acyl-carrier-protein] synthase III
MYSRIAGTGSYLPKKILTNADLERLVDTSDEWIRSRTGIECRHVVSEGETTTDLAEHAARRALADAEVAPEDVDLICVGTTTPDLVFPNVGTLLQERLGITNTCPAFSLEAACTGFMYALAVADKFIRLEESKCALVVGAETLTRIVDWNDRGTCVLFADGAGAVVLKPSAEPGIISTRLHSDGRYKDLLMYPDGVSLGFNLVREGKAGVQMKGNEVYKFAVNTLGQLVTETLNANNISKDQLDWLIPHQANIRIIEAIARRLEVPMSRVIVTIGDQGNTSAASVPLALDTGIRDGRVRRGQLLLLEAFGGGFTWGSALIRY